MPEDPLLDQAIAAVKAYDRKKARDILSRLIKVDPRNARYWLWLSTVVDTPKEITYCLQEVLKIDPDNAIAKRGLVFFNVKKPDKGSYDNLYTQKTDWQSEVSKKFAPPPPEKPQKSQGKKNFPALAVGIFLILAIIVAGAIFIPKAFQKPAPVITLVRPTSKASATYLPTVTPKGYKPSPTPKGAPPLWTLLKETYTPTPLYVDTPHPMEAYQLAMRAYPKGDWDTFNRYMQQALQTDPNMPDAYFYLGEASRTTKDYNSALMYYEKALSLSPKFSSAILAHAEVLQIVKPKTNILDDLNKAIKYDPALLEAYIIRAKYFLDRNQYDAAMDDLTTARELNPNSSLVYLSLAQIYLAKDEPKLALENAQKAYQLDITFLDTYLVLGAAYIADGQPDKALEPLDTYLTYQPYDANAYEMVGKAYWVAGDSTKALENLNKSISLDTNSFDAYYILGVSAFKSGNPNEALDDLTKALAIDDNHYDAVFYRAQALLQMQRNTDAYNQFLRAEDLAKTDDQRADSVYYQAKSAMAVGNRSNILDAWKRLLALPEDSMEPEWRTEAYNYLHPCKGKTCLTMTATYMLSAIPTSAGTITPAATTPTAVKNTPAATP
jgi:tetratricopeptide (TPR) repeat protein